MSSSRDRILNRLRRAQSPFPDAPPRPNAYLPVTVIEDTSPDGLLARFKLELERLMGQVFVVEGDAAARACVLDLLASHEAQHVLAWDFAHIPVDGLEAAVRETGIRIDQPHMRDEARPETIKAASLAQVGLTGADYALATTGTLVFHTAPGKGRLPTILAPVHIAVIRLDQLLPRLEDWLAVQRAQGLDPLRASANVCFTSGPSRTADLEMILILGVHGPKNLQVVVKR